MTAALPIVFIPGASSDETAWCLQERHFTQKRRALTVGLTDLDDIGAMAARVLAAIDGDFILCGTSMGGYVALDVIRKAPQRVKKAVFCCTSARADTPERARQRRIEVAQGAQAWHAARQEDTHYHAFLGQRAQSDAALIAALRAISLRTGYDCFARHQHACAQRPDSRNLLPQIHIPTLVISGEEDALIPPEMQEEMHALLPCAELASIAGAGHIAHMEDAAAVTTAIENFIAA
jgi:pimeloyl-ACP methyl ester carboxylesterase